MLGKAMTVSAADRPVKAFTVSPIGRVRSPYKEKRHAPRQPSARGGVDGTIELFAGYNYEHALLDLDAWSHIWVLFWFDRSTGWKPRVQPPRSAVKRGTFATRSPHRPNPIGMSVLELTRVEGRILHVRGLDMLDATPVLDIKPYVPYADVRAQAGSGWLEQDALAPRDPGPCFAVRFSERAEAQLQWLAARTDIDLRGLAESTLALGPTPHPYRRIRARGSELQLGLKDFRLRFEARDGEIVVLEIATGYRKRVLLDPLALASERTPLDVHRAFVATFGARASK
jgi:tRNA-Thr(GGU) m(6)t(6)A37 methyltransferase TsaA